MDTIDKTDEILLKRFFENTQEHVEDNRFTERVMDSLPIRTTPLRWWSQSLNVVAILGCVALLINFRFFEQLWEFLIQFFQRIFIAFITFDLESLLVRIMLFLHHLPQLMPTPTQLLTLLIGLTFLMFLGIQRIFKSI